MADGFLGGLFGGDTLLWFIILFLLLFWCTSRYGFGYGCSTDVAK